MSTPNFTATSSATISSAGTGAPAADPAAPNPTPDQLDVTAQAARIVENLSVEELVGLLFHPMVLIGADHDPDAPSPLGPSTRELIVERGVRFLCLGAMPSPQETARITAQLQEIATSVGSRLPLVFSTDPRHSFLQVGGAAHTADGVSQWPEPIGLGAIGDADLVRQFGQVVQRDYRAMGIRMALHPQVDLTTDARWARQAQSFGTDAAETSRLLRAYLEGMQGTDPAHVGVAAVVKHFPGGGAQKDGEDPHFPYGREQIYPGNNFAEHLAPFRTAIAAGAAAIMPYYGMPVGLHWNGEAVEEVGFGFNRDLIAGLLRQELGFDGVVLSDFGLVNDAVVFGKPFPARAWGVEDLTPAQRIARMLEAGVDQFGGEHDTSVLLELISSGAVSADRVAQSATRIARMMLTLGLSQGTVPSLPDDTLAGQTGAVPAGLAVGAGAGLMAGSTGAVSDGAASAAAIPLAQDVAAGLAAQSRAVTVLTNGEVQGQPVLPLTTPRRVYLEGLSAQELPEGWLATSVEEAELAIVRLTAPFEPRDTYFLEAGMQQGSLEFSAETVAHVAELAAHVPVVAAVTLSRPAILTPLLPHVTALVGEFGASDRAIVDSLTGVVPPQGRLPFELPRSMAAVAASEPDVGANTLDPIFPIGWGKTLAGAAVAEHTDSAPAESAHDDEEARA